MYLSVTLIILWRRCNLDVRRWGGRRRRRRRLRFLQQCIECALGMEEEQHKRAITIEATSSTVISALPPSAQDLLCHNLSWSFATIPIDKTLESEQYCTSTRHHAACTSKSHPRLPGSSLAVTFYGQGIKYLCKATDCITMHPFDRVSSNGSLGGHLVRSGLETGSCWQYGSLKTKYQESDEDIPKPADWRHEPKPTLEIVAQSHFTGNLIIFTNVLGVYAIQSKWWDHILLCINVESTSIWRPDGPITNHHLPHNPLL